MQQLFFNKMQRDVIITDEFVLLWVSNTINLFDKMLGVLKRIIPSVSAKASLSSTARTGPHLSIFASVNSTGGFLCNISRLNISCMFLVVCVFQNNSSSCFFINNCSD